MTCSPASAPASIEVLAAGPRTLIQDLGRHGSAHLGVPTSGAADPDALALANTLVGNCEGVAALEVTLGGPTLRFLTDRLVAYAGPDADVFLDGLRAATHHTLHVRAGQTLRVGSLRGGIFGYLAFSGGLGGTPVLGSLSSDTLSGLGPAPLGVGDHLRVGEPGEQVNRAARLNADDTTRRAIRYVAGPHGRWFSDAAHSQFSQTSWHVSPASSRVGIRLDGGAVSVQEGSLPSMGMTRGAIQVPPNGKPIVLGPDHGTTGGYPVLGVVVPADLALLAQAVPGSVVRFSPVTLQDAVAEERIPRRVIELDRVC